MNVSSAIWLISITLFLGGIGLPVPENPVLLGGGYAIYKKFSSPIPSLCLWYLAILCGDILLFATAHLFFTRPAILNLLKRYVGEKRFIRHQATLKYWGGWMLFLSRFTFGLRALAYIAAGLAHYPWLRFLSVDGLSVGIQVLLFVGIGYYAGERIEWAKATGEKVALLLGIFALVSILAAWVSSAIMKRLSRAALAENKDPGPEEPTLE